MAVYRRVTKPGRVKPTRDVRAIARALRLAKQQREKQKSRRAR
jgi:hypothetical protein